MRDDKKSIEKSRSQSLSALLSNRFERSNEKMSLKEKLINYCPFTFLYPCLFKLVGIKLGSKVTFRGKIKIKIKGKFSNIIIGDGVVFSKNVFLINREEGEIILKDNVYIDENVRLLAARNGKIIIDIGTEVGNGTVINSGGETSIGKFCMIASFVSINSSSHGVKKSEFIKYQPHEHGRINISDDVWIGSNASILMGSSISRGAVIGAHSLVNSDIPEFGIAVGVPSRVIKFRE